MQAHARSDDNAYGAVDERQLGCCGSSADDPHFDGGRDGQFR